MVKRLGFFISILYFICLSAHPENIDLPELRLSDLPELNEIVDNVVDDCEFILGEGEETSNMTFLMKISKGIFKDGYDVEVSLNGSNTELSKDLDLDNIKGYVKVGDNTIIIWVNDMLESNEIGNFMTFLISDDPPSYPRKLEWMYFIPFDNNSSSLKTIKVGFINGMKRVTFLKKVENE